MPSDNTGILYFNQYRKSDKTPSIFYADLKFLVEIIDGCKNNSEKSSALKVDHHISCGYLIQYLHLIWTFHGIEKSMMYTEVNIA